MGAGCWVLGAVRMIRNGGKVSPRAKDAVSSRQSRVLPWHM